MTTKNDMNDNDSASQKSSDDFFSTPKKSSHILLWLFAIFIIIGLIWARLAIIDEVTHGEGKVIPSTQIQVIQNLEGGIVNKVFVREGEVVNKSQVLMKIDDTRFLSAYQEGLMKQLSLEIKISRLLAESGNKALSIPEKLMQERPDLVSHEKELYRSKMQEIAEKRHSYETARKELQLLKPLVKTGAASPVEVLRQEREVSQLKQSILDFYNKTLDELNTAKSELKILNETNRGNLDRVSRTTIRSPVKGIVKIIKITTVGGVAQPGMELMEIVPFEDTLLIEAQIKPKDIGFITIGQNALVKISAYDFSIYGGLNGKVEQISADSITNQKGDSFYLIRVRTQKNYLGNDKKRLYIIPGMLATVDIMTGKKSVLDYLLKPILKAKENALRER